MLISKRKACPPNSLKTPCINHARIVLTVAQPTHLLHAPMDLRASKIKTYVVPRNVTYSAVVKGAEIFRELKASVRAMMRQNIGWLAEEFPVMAQGHGELSRRKMGTSFFLAVTSIHGGPFVLQTRLQRLPSASPLPAWSNSSSFTVHRRNTAQFSSLVQPTPSLGNLGGKRLHFAVKLYMDIPKQIDVHI